MLLLLCKGAFARTPQATPSAKLTGQANARIFLPCKSFNHRYMKFVAGNYTGRFVTSVCPGYRD